MEVPGGYAELSDADLSERVAEGDDYALAALYDRHVADLHDFVARLLRDDAAAAEVVHDSFVKAWQAKPASGATGIRGRLFTLAHAVAVRHKPKRRSTAIQRRPDLGSLQAERLPPDADLADQQQLADLLWAWAAGLRPTDYAVVDLHLRQGLPTDDVAKATSLKPGEVNARLERFDAEARRGIAPTLLARHGRDLCSELDATIASVPRTAAPGTVEDAVRRHADKCQTCRDLASQLPSPAALLAALAPVPLSPGRRDELWDRISGAITTANKDPAKRPPKRPSREPQTRAMPTVAAGEPATVVRSTRAPTGAAPPLWARTPVLAAAGAMGVFLLLLAFLLTRGGDGGGDAPRLADPANIESTTHQVGVGSELNQVTLAWTPTPGATGYSTSWSRAPRDVPDARADLPGPATGTTSPVLEQGSWWFHLRTQGPGGAWTSTAHVGPFVILAPPLTTLPPVLDTTTTTTTRQAPTTILTLPPATTIPTTTTTAPPTTLPPTTLPPTTTTLPPPTTTLPPPTTTTTLPPTTTTTLPPPTTTTLPPTTTTTAAPLP